MFKFSTLTRGDPRLPPLIFLHGFTGCKEDWEEFFPFFEKSYHCIAFDLPGHGQTPYTEDILLATRAEIQRICKEKPILIGYSMGGRIAMRLKDQAQSLVILSAHLGLKTEEEKQARLRIDKEWSEKLLTLPFEAYLSEWYAQPIFQVCGVPKQRLFNQNPRSLSQVLLQMSLAHQEYCADFPCPALFLYGEKDLKYADLYRKLPDTVTVHEIEHCGHAAHLSHAPICSQIISNWLEKTHANT